MEKQHKTKTKILHLLATTFIISLSVASFVLCIMCELKKSKKKELRVDGELCYLPQSQAFGYGITASVCSSIAQILGTGFFISCRRSIDFKSSRTSVACILLLLSWASFFIMMILTGTATSMNRRQAVGEGWVDGVCYLVKNSVYVGSGILVLTAMTSTLASCYLMINKSRAVHAQVK
ncbi:protein MODIFYING WALL LIGNIN-1-like [Bidens hawaiensis]|uniref:protein MODIFYING WALL LIGNIN-1-like n=1 Tax=Bidens hawaiensis TaxID=980011 RepID=UPI00404A6703